MSAAAQTARRPVAVDSEGPVHPGLHRDGDPHAVWGKLRHTADPVR